MRPYSLRPGALAAVHVVAGIAVVAVQFTATIRDRSTWPFCSYNMFNRALPNRMPNHLRIILLDDAGGRSAPLRVWGLLPLEHFRVASTFLTVYLAGDDEQEQRALAEQVLSLVNDAPWRSFDQRKAPPRPPAGRRFVGFELFRVALDLTTYDGRTDSPYADQELLYRYQVPVVSPR